MLYNIKFNIRLQISVMHSVTSVTYGYD